MAVSMESYAGSDTAKAAILTKIVNDLTELFTIAAEVEAARDGAASLLAQINVLQASILAVTAANGSLISADDTTPGYLNGKAVAGTGITLTEGSGGGNETLTWAIDTSYMDALLKKTGVL